MQQNPRGCKARAKADKIYRGSRHMQHAIEKLPQKSAKKRLVEIRAAENGEQDMRAIAASIAKLPPGQLKKVLTDDIIAILAKYGVVI